MTLNIRTRLTLWYAALIAAILFLLGSGVLLSASWGLRKAADEELTSGIGGVKTFLLHKLDIHQMYDLNDELREHSSLLPRGKMFRASRPDGSVIYQPDAMIPIPALVPSPAGLSKASVVANGHPYRTISQFVHVGSFTFLVQVAVDQSGYQDLIAGLAWILLLSIPLAGLLAAIAGYWLSGRVLRPIDFITETTNSIDARSLSRRLPLLGTGDELDRLSATINRMLDRIATSYERIAQFTTDASHELRTPVTLIRSNAELLLMSPDNNPRVQSGLKDILAESTYMTRLIGDLLTLARGADDERSLPIELLELNESVRSILERAQAQAATRNISLGFIEHEQIVPIRGNQIMVERILTILIDNAVRYTPPGGRISLQTWVGPERCGFVVRDTGIGIAKEHHQRIFERFFRVNEARTPRDGGYGLGLAIARNLIDLHGGEVSIDSEPGQGSSFCVSFSRADVPLTTVTA